jgi:hemoglobin
MPGMIKHPHGHEFHAPPPNPPPPDGATALFERLGGREGVSRLVKWFYARVRFEPDLEPIFNANVPRWSEHLEVLIDFWCTQAGGPSTYRGGLGKHARLDLKPEHFETWLRVWEQNCTDLLEPREAGEMIGLARALAIKMQGMEARS